MAGQPLNLNTVKSYPPLFGRGLARVNEIAEFLDTTVKHAYNTLRVGGNVVGYTTDFATVGADTYAVDIINTSTSISSAASVAATGALTVTITAHGLVVGDLIRMDSEIMRVGQVIDVNTVYIGPFGGGPGSGASNVGAPNSVASGRGACGTTAATHASATIYTSNHKGSVVALGQYPVGLVTTLTPTAFATAFTGTINDHPAPYNHNGFYAAVVEPGAPVDTSYYNVIVYATSLGVFTPACSSTFTSSNNYWDWGALAQGRNPEHSRHYAGVHYVTTEDVTMGQFDIPLDFAYEPGCRIVQVLRAGVVFSTWDGALTFTDPNAPIFTISDVTTGPVPSGYEGVTGASVYLAPTGGTFTVTVTVRGVDYTTAGVAYGTSAATLRSALLVATNEAGNNFITTGDYVNGTITAAGGTLPGTAISLKFGGFGTEDIKVSVNSASLTVAGGTSLYVPSAEAQTGALGGQQVIATFTITGGSHTMAAGDAVSWIFSE